MKQIFDLAYYLGDRYSDITTRSFLHGSIEWFGCEEVVTTGFKIIFRSGIRRFTLEHSLNAVLLPIQLYASGRFLPATINDIQATDINQLYTDLCYL